MSDHDNFDGFMSDNKGFELPVRSQMFQRTNNLLEQYTNEAIEAIKTGKSPEKGDAIEAYINSPDNDFYLTFLPKKLPIKIGKAKEIEINHLLSSEHDPGHKYLYLSLRGYGYGGPGDPGDPIVYNDGSTLELWNEIIVAISPDAEEPPFIFEAGDYEKEREVRHPLPFEDYKMIKHQQGKDVTELDEDQCKALLDALGEQTLDIFGMDMWRERDTRAQGTDH